MDESVKTCDQCGERQLSANGWIRYQDSMSGSFVVLTKKSRVRVFGYRDACGHTCVIKAFNNWLTAVHVNAPVEVKKDGN